MLQPHNSPNPEIQIPRYKFKLFQYLNLNLYREIPRNLSFWIWWISEVLHFQWNRHMYIAIYVAIYMFAVCVTRLTNMSDITHDVTHPYV